MVNTYSDRRDKFGLFPVSMPSRRAEDHIRELCAKIVVSNDSKEVELMLVQLRSAIHQFIGRLRLNAVTILNACESPQERRKLS